MKIRCKIVSLLISAALIVTSCSLTMTVEAITILPNNLEQLVSNDTEFSNHELIYSDRYKFALEYGGEDEQCDTLVVYGLTDKDCYNFEWKEHIVINEDLYPCMRDVYHYPTGLDRTICSGWTYHVGYVDLMEYVFEKPLRIMFFIEGEAPYQFGTAAVASKAYGFDIEPYIAVELPEGEKYGDINLDEEVDVADVIAINLYMMSDENYPLTSEAKANADCVRDNVINEYDSVVLLNYIEELIQYSELGE